MPSDLFLPVVLAGVFGLLLYSSSRTRKRTQKAAADLKASLVPGQQVMTGSGLFATVVEVDDDAVLLETSPGVTSRWLLAAVAKLVDPPVPGDGEDADDEAYDDEYEDEYDEYDDDEDEDDEAADAAVGDEVDVPDDVSSLTTDPGEDDAPRR